MVTITKKHADELDAIMNIALGGQIVGSLYKGATQEELDYASMCKLICEKYGFFDALGNGYRINALGKHNMNMHSYKPFYRMHINEAIEGNKKHLQDELVKESLQLARAQQKEIDRNTLFSLGSFGIAALSLVLAAIALVRSC